MSSPDEAPWRPPQRRATGGGAAEQGPSAPTTGGWAAPGHGGPSQGWGPPPGYGQPDYGRPGHGQPGQGWAPPSGPTWGPAPGWGPPSPARRRRRPLLVVLVVLGVLLLLAVLVVLALGLLVGPRFLRYDVLDARAVEQGVTRIVDTEWHRGATGVRCPDDRRARANVTFFCTATVDGRPAQIPVSVLDDAGTYAVGQPR